MSVCRSVSSASLGGGSVLLACGARSCTAVLVVTQWWGWSCSGWKLL